jgi:hypothetical protein
VPTFISYSRADSSFAVKLARDLKSAGFDVWLDQLDIPTGARWDDEVEAALEACKIFMIILSPESLQSQNVKDEVGYAIDSGKDILPVKIKSGEIPFRLRRFQYVDFSKQSYNENLKEIKSLLTAMGNIPVAKEAKKESLDAEGSSTQKKIKAITPDPSPTIPTTKKTETADFPRRSTPVPRGLLIGIAAVAILAIAGVIVRSLGAQGSAATPPTEEVPVAQTLPTEHFTAQPIPDTGQASTPTEPGPPGAFLMEFNGSSDLADWQNSVLGTGRRTKVEVSPSNDGLIFHLDDPDLRAYYIYEPAIYGNVVIRIKAENLGQNTYQISLVCRMNAEGTQWYEYRIIGGGLWNLYDYSGKYHSLTNGGTFALNPGKSINEYEMRCLGDQLSLRINSEEVSAYQIKKNLYAEGQVGFSISSGKVFPIDMKVLEFEVSSR